VCCMMQSMTTGGSGLSVGSGIMAPECCSDIAIAVCAMRRDDGETIHFRAHNQWRAATPRLVLLPSAETRARGFKVAPQVAAGGEVSAYALKCQTILSHRIKSMYTHTTY
jgi:hypothetical protein